MNYKNANIAFKSAISLILLTLLLSIHGCGGSGGGDGHGHVHDNPGVNPRLVMDPNDKTPLAGELILTTTQESKVSVSITDGTNSWVANFDTLATSHTLPLYGFRPDRRHTLTVTAVDNMDQAIELQTPNLSITTDPLPAEFPTITITNIDQAKIQPGYTLFGAIAHGATNLNLGSTLIIVDQGGEVVWYSPVGIYNPLDVRSLPTGNIVYMLGNNMHEIDMLGNKVNIWSSNKGFTGASVTKVDTTTFHHEVFPVIDPMDNSLSSMITLSLEVPQLTNFPLDYTSTPQFSTAAPNTVPVVGDVVVEFDPIDGQIINQWSMLEMLKPATDPYRIGFLSLGGHWNSSFPNMGRTYDWSHGNGVVYSQADNSILVSLRHQDALVKFSRDTGTISWILSPPENWSADFQSLLVARDETETVPVEAFFPYHQHAPEILDNGNILVYDNGNYRASPPFDPQKSTDPDTPPSETYTRAVEYEINTANTPPTAKIVWEYGRELPQTLYSGSLGDADRLANNNTLITHGSLSDVNDKYYSKILEVTHSTATPANEVVFEMDVSDSASPNPNLLYQVGWRVYRAERRASLYMTP